MIVTVGNQKGGVGKSTIAVNMAVEAAKDRKKILLVDADPQASSMSWRALRQSDDIKAIAITAPTLHKDLRTMEGFDIIIIDAGGRDTAVFRSAIMACDLLIIPVLPSQFDIFAADDTIKILREARVFKDVEAAFVLNQLILSAKVSQEAEEALKSFGEDAPLLDARLYARVAYKNCLENGQGVTEYEPSGKASQEVKALYNAITKILGGGKSQ